MERTGDPTALKYKQLATGLINCYIYFEVYLNGFYCKTIWMMSNKIPLNGCLQFKPNYKPIIILTKNK